MHTATLTPPKYQRIIGWVFVVLIAGLLLFSASGKFLQPAGMEEGLAGIGWRKDQMLWLGIVETLCVVLFVIPRTTVLGAVLITGYMGGAMATHVRVDEPWVVQFLVGVVAWVSVFLREPRLRSLLPIRRSVKVV